MALFPRGLRGPLWGPQGLSTEGTCAGTGAEGVVDPVGQATCYQRPGLAWLGLAWLVWLGFSWLFLGFGLICIGFGLIWLALAFIH